MCIKKSFLFFLSSCPLPILLHQVLFRKTLEQGPQTFPVKDQIVLILDFASHIVSVTVTGLATVVCKTTCKRTVCTTLFTKIKQFANPYSRIPAVGDGAPPDVALIFSLALTLVVWLPKMTQKEQSQDWNGLPEPQLMLISTSPHFSEEHNYDLLRQRVEVLLLCQKPLMVPHRALEKESFPKPGIQVHQSRNPSSSFECLAHCALPKISAASIHICSLTLL